MPVILPLHTKVSLDPDAQKLLAALPSLEARLPSKGYEIAYLRRFLRSKDLRYLMHVFRRLRSVRRLRPVADFSVAQAAEVFCTIRFRSEDSHVQELLYILSRPHLQALLYTHDKVASSDYEPRLDPSPVDRDEDQAAVKIIRLIKTNEPLGVTIQLCEDSDSLEIARVLHGGAADRSGLIRVGDELQEVNGVCVKGQNPDDVIEMLTRITGAVTLKLVPSHFRNGPEHRPSQMRVRTLFTYDPESDPNNPCPDASLAFTRGEILHIVNQDDATWWQARKEGEIISRAGLIPSKQLQESYIMKIKRDEQETLEKSGMRSLSPCRYSPKIPRQKKLRKTMYHTVQNLDYDTEEIPTYEEVELHHMKPRTFRPIVLIGPSGVGCNELKRRLKASNPCHFHEVVPYTSRPKKPFEEDGQEYHFLSREDMEKDILAQSFAEYGEYKGNLYGTSLDSIRAVIAAGQVCLLTPHTQALKFLRTADIKPYIIFIKPPSLENLRLTRLVHRARTTVEEDVTRPFTEEELQQILETGTRIEERYGHLFDNVIVNETIEDATADLVQIAEQIEKDLQWIPIGWNQ
ncbi:MAGUK p55 subfamily member 7-like [Gigantopelta aegis]|uniref:MAGUK p55 subfamily member 7-like n=1 Tax=Gigantopelta aegis TaxID=1735272 RepID=UPI001B88E3F0|nr:MAGUK p55 subfamily member 7-like [Gigantopelta aegis]